MISTGDIKKGSSIEVDGNLYQVVEVQHVKTKKSAVYRVKMRDLRGGHIIERTFNAGEKLAAARVDRRDMQYLYADDLGLTFMHPQTYEQIVVPRAVAGDALKYLRDGDVAQVSLYGEEALGIEMPAAVNLKVVRTEAGVKGDTATGATKHATVETGLVVSVPLFINEGDTLKIGTESGNYIERVNNA